MTDRRLYVLLDPDPRLPGYHVFDRLHIRTTAPPRFTRCGLHYTDLIGPARKVPKSVICSDCTKPLGHPHRITP